MAKDALTRRRASDEARLPLAEDGDRRPVLIVRAGEPRDGAPRTILERVRQLLEELEGRRE